MNILLYLPGLLVILVKSRGLHLTILNLLTIVMFQIFVAAPFLLTYPTQYFSNAFEFRRVFLYKWTVNWRFVPEEVFLSRPFALVLLGFHLCTLIAFGLRRWCSRDDGAWRLIKRAITVPDRPAGLVRVSADGERLTFIIEFPRHSPNIRVLATFVDLKR
jgi:alpha-1,3-mannosyltransferase